MCFIIHLFSNKVGCKLKNYTTRGNNLCIRKVSSNLLFHKLQKNNSTSKSCVFVTISDWVICRVLQAGKWNFERGWKPWKPWKMIILRPKSVIFERFWLLPKFHFPGCSTLYISYIFFYPNLLDARYASSVSMVRLQSGMTIFFFLTSIFFHHYYKNFKAN